MARTGISMSVLARATAIGVVAGMRSQLPFALLALSARRGKIVSNATGPLGFLRSGAAAVGFGLAAAGELVGDKLPITPSRLRPGSLVVRGLVGAAAGAIVALDDDAAAPGGALAGLAGSVAGSFGGYWLRANAARVTGLPDPAWAVAEDVLGIGLGLVALAPNGRGEQG